MHTRTCAALVVLLALASSSQAESLQRIRTTSPYVQTVLTSASEKSPTLRSIVERIAASNVIVYVTCVRFASVALNGRTLWAEANSGARYLRVQVDCMLPRANLVAILAHELQHVAEVADAPAVVDEATFGKLFSVIGYSTCSRFSEQYETDGAIVAGERVRQEFSYHWPVGARVVANAGGGVPAQ
jgi:hypothetical protein